MMDCLSKLFTFRKIFKNCNDSDETIEEEITIDKNWHSFWLEYGDDYVNSTWLELYKDYIDTDYLKIEENIQSLDLCEQQSEYNQINTNSVQNSEDWQSLWQEHYQQTYEKCFILYRMCFNEAQQRFILFENNELQTDDVSSIKSSSTNDSTDIDLEDTLKSFGLPTAFTSRSEFYKSKNKELTDEYSDYSSEETSDEMEELDDLIENLHDPLETQLQPQTDVKSKRKKNKRKNLKRLRIPDTIKGDKCLEKYWKKRFHLFSLFDKGIKLDKESWFSVTPEKIAINIANRMKNFEVVIDGFCGSGGNCIQLAKKCQKIIAIDIDPEKIELAKNNARIYGVEEKIEFIVGDFLQLVETMKSDAIFLSPPWGGPKYINSSVYDIEKNLIPIPASQLINRCRRITNNLSLYLPRNSNKEQIIKTAEVGGNVEIVQNYLNNKLVALTVFYGDLIQKNS